MTRYTGNRSPSFSAAFMCLLLLGQALLLTPAAGVLVGVEGNQFIGINASNSNKTTFCTSTATSHCDSTHSVVIGYDDYDDGDVAALFEFEVPKAECLDDEEFEVRMSVQINGPTPERGWGQSMTNINQNYVAVELRDYAETGTVYDIADATASYKYFPERSNKYGSISTTDDNRNFRNITIGPIPANGTIAMTREDGLYLSNPDPVTELSKAKVSVLNHPWNKYGGSDNLRTEIEWIGIEYQDETTAPNNPSSSGISDIVISTSQNYPTFGGIDTWTYTRQFDIKFNGGDAYDLCSSASLQFDFVPANSNQQPTPTASSSSASAKNRLWIPPTDGEYELHYRAIDENGNVANWDKVPGHFKLDRTKPVISSVMNTPQGWYSLSGNSIPTVSWNEWTDQSSGMASYTLTAPGRSWSHTIVSQNNPLNGYTWTPSNSDINVFSDSSYCKPNAFILTGTDDTKPTANLRDTWFTVNIDTCMPIVNPILQPNGNWYNTNTPTLHFNAPSDGQGSGIASCSLLVPGVVNYSIPVSKCTSTAPSQSIYLPDGVHYVGLQVCDLVNNCNTSTTTISVDSKAPIVLTSSSSTHLSGSWSNQNIVNLSVSLSDATTGAITTSSNMERIWVKVAPSTTPMTVNQIKSGNTTVCSGSVTCTIGTSHTLLSGGYSVYLVAKDNAGNQLHQVLNMTLAIDVDSPTQHIPSFNQTLSAGNSTLLSWQASTDVHSGVDYYIVNLLDIDRNTTTTQFVQSISLQFWDLLEGNYSACVRSVDNVGLQSANLCTLQQLRIDSSAPSLSSSVNVTGWTNTTSYVRLIWNSSDTSSSTTMRYSLDSNPYSSLYPSNGSLILSQLPNGWHTVRVLVQDAAGNSIISSHQFGIDRIAPVTNLSSSQAGGWTNIDQQLITWSALDNSAGSGIDLVQLIINSGEPLNISTTGQMYLNLSTGIHHVQLRVQDVAGNHQTNSMTFRIDTSIPSSQCSIQPNDWTNGLLHLNIAPNANGSISPFYWALYVNSVEDATASIGGNSYNLPNGIHVFNLATWNAAGGQSSCQVIGSVDKSNPVILTTSLLPTHLNQSTFNFTIQAADSGASGLDSYIASVDSTTLSQGLYTNGFYVLDFSNFTDGTHELTFAINDRAGNIVQLTHSFILDRKSPTIAQFQITNTAVNGWYYEQEIDVLWSAYDELDTNLDATMFLNNQPIGSSFELSPKTLQLPIGIHTLGIMVVDDSGNNDFLSMEVSIDFQIPTCVFTNSLDNRWSSDHEVTISPSCVQSPSNVSTTYSLNGGQSQPLDGVKTVQLLHGTNNIEILTESGSSMSSQYSYRFLSDQYAPTLWAELESQDASDYYADGRMRLDFSAPFDGASPLSYHIYLNDQLESEAYGFEEELNQSYVFTNLEQGYNEIRIQVSDESGQSVTRVFDEVLVNFDVSPMNLNCKFGDNTNTFAIDSAESLVVISSIELVNPRVDCAVYDGLSTVDLPSGFGTIVSVHVNEMPEIVNLVQEEPNHFTFRMSPLNGNDFIGWIDLSIVTIDRWGNLGNHSFNLFVKHSVQTINSYNSLNVEIDRLDPQEIVHEFLIIGLHASQTPVVTLYARLPGEENWNISINDYEFRPAQGELGKYVLSFKEPDEILIGHTASDPLVYEVYISAMDEMVPEFNEVFQLSLDGCKSPGLRLDISPNGMVSCQAVEYVGPTLPTHTLELNYSNTQSMSRMIEPGVVDDSRSAQESCKVFNQIGQFQIEIVDGNVSVSSAESNGSFTILCEDVHGLNESYTIPIQLLPEEKRQDQSNNKEIRRFFDMAIGAGVMLIIGLLIVGVSKYHNSKIEEEEY